MQALKQPKPLELGNATHDQKVAHLRAVALFEDIKESAEALGALAMIWEERVYAPNRKIIEEGAASDEMFILIAGAASVYKTTPEGDVFKVAILLSENHAFFGEGGLVDAEVRSATIKSDTECHCLVLSRGAFQEFGKLHPEWTLPFFQRITSMVMGRLRKTNGDLLVLYCALLAEIRGH